MVKKSLEFPRKCRAKDTRKDLYWCFFVIWSTFVRSKRNFGRVISTFWIDRWLTAMTNLCRRHFTAARWEPLWLIIYLRSMACDYVEQISGDARARYKVKFSLSGLEECPFRLAADLWEDDPTQWPSLEYGVVYFKSKHREWDVAKSPESEARVVFFLTERKRWVLKSIWIRVDGDLVQIHTWRNICYEN